MTTLLHLPFNSEPDVPGFVFDESPFRRGVKFQGNAGLRGDSFVFGNAAASFDGSGDYGLVENTGGSLYVGLGDFTTGAWVFLTGNSSPAPSGERRAMILSIDNGAVGFFEFQIAGSALLTGTGLAIWGSADSGWVSVPCSIPLGVWSHCAVCRSEGVLRFFLNGQQQGGDKPFSYRLGSASASDTAKVGGRPSSSNNTYFLNGLIDDLFLTDTALYTTDFTPSRFEYSHATLRAVGAPLIDRARGYDVPSPRASRLGINSGRSDQQYGGAGLIASTVKIKGQPDIPVARRVRLHESRTGNVVRETWSDVAGNYEFRGIDPGNNYYVVGFDHTGSYRGVIADNLTPELT